MKLVVVGDPDDVRGALLAGASYCRTVEEALADPEVGLVLSNSPHPDPRVMPLLKGGSDAAAGQPGRRLRRRA